MTVSKLGLGDVSSLTRPSNDRTAGFHDLCCSRCLALALSELLCCILFEITLDHQTFSSGRSQMSSSSPLATPKASRYAVLRDVSDPAIAAYSPVAPANMSCPGALSQKPSATPNTDSHSDATAMSTNHC